MKAGELCAGYGGLALAVEEVFHAETAWFSEFDPAPSKILAHHWPNVPNHGDMTKINWDNIEPVDIISGGTPCQDLSGAGRRRGMTDGTRSNLWVQMREAIATIQPRYVVWENVRGAYSAKADSDLEHCPRCMGDPRDERVVLRALGRVLGDLSDLGFNAEWRGLRAADVGACHSRFRVFVLAYDTRSRRGNQTLKHNGRGAQAEHWTGIPDESDSHPLRPRPLRETTTDRHYLGHERGRDSRGRGARLEDGSNPPSDAKRNGWRKWSPEPGQSPQLPNHYGGLGKGRLGAKDSHQEGTEWGEYAAAIHRWESVMGRCAPAPTEPTGRDGGHRLSPRFTEWMMGLPEGWVTDPTIGISRNEQLKACGNGVVPQQAIAALRDMLAAFQAREEEAA